MKIGVSEAWLSSSSRPTTAAAATLARVRVMRLAAVARREGAKKRREARLALAEARVAQARDVGERGGRAWAARQAHAAAAHDAALARLVMRYGAVAAAERSAVVVVEREADVARERARVALESRRRLRVFGAHCEHETRGAASVRRLAEDDAQRRRCARAAAENARRRAGVEVLDVYKIENRVLLDKFHALAEHHERSKKKRVKGLFCSVPARCLERVVAFGFRDAPECEALERAVFDDVRSSSEAPGRCAATAAALATLPRPFSRCSTHFDDDDSSGVRYLALCRVLVGNAKWTTAAGTEDCDSTYDPHTEEYRPRHAEQVLPEFLLAYRPLLNDEGGDHSSCAWGGYFERRDDDGAHYNPHLALSASLAPPPLVGLAAHPLGGRHARPPATVDPPDSWDGVLQAAAAEKLAIVDAISQLIARLSAEAESNHGVWNKKPPPASFFSTKRRPSSGRRRPHQDVEE